MSEMVFASALANKRVCSALKSYLDDFRWQSETAKKLIKFFTAPRQDGHVFSPIELETFLTNCSIEDEREKIIRLATEYADLKEDYQIQSVLESFNEFYNKRRLQEILQEGAEDSEWIIKQISDIRKVNSVPIPIDRVCDLDVDEVMREAFGDGEVIPTSFGFLKKSMPWPGYMRGQVVLVCAPPGVGKSIFLANETVEMLRKGFKVYWLALGDMMRYDFITRLSALITGEDLTKVSVQPQIYFNDEVKALTKNLRLSVLPAGQVDIFNVRDYIENYVCPQEEIDVFILDYDANLLQKQESMYLAGDEIYNVMSQIARPSNSLNRVAFIASQPKIQYWEFDELPKEAAGESSRKQAIVDVMVTIGKSSAHQTHHMGVMKAAKLRRGREGVRSYYRLSETGKIIEVLKEDYDRMRTSDNKKPFGGKRKF